MGNTGVATDWTPNFLRPEKGGERQSYIPYGVYNMGPCQLPGGRLMFTSNRNAMKPPKHPGPCLQLFTIDDVDDSADAERNVEEIGFMNVGMALHPTVITDGRVMFSSLESQGLRSSIEWALWTIHPDGTAWAPLISAFNPGGGAPNAFHFQTQLSDGAIVAEEYYNQNNSGFGTYYKLPLVAESASYVMGPAFRDDPRNPKLRIGRHDNGRPQYTRLAFSPPGIEALTRFATPHDGPADRSIRGDKSSPAVGKFTHPSGAPDNHLLTIYSPGPANHQYTYHPQIDGGIYLLKNGAAIDEPSQLRLIKNDPLYNEQWPRAVVPYRRIYGIDEPRRLAPLRNDGSRSRHLPAGTPFALVGTSSLYKRETFPRGAVPPGAFAAVYRDDDKSGYRGLEKFNSSDESTGNWLNQGAEAGLYTSDDIHAVRILAMEGSSDFRGPGKARGFYSHANERLRILGEIPVRKPDASGKEPLDPDGNPDTSFLAKIPADTAFTFQTIDRRGMLLNMAQTWHQARPGEIRNNCGGCHAHSEQPTPFELTAAGRADYAVFDLTKAAPLLTERTRDDSGRKFDRDGATGLRHDRASVVNVEFHRDIRPLLERSCVACHTGKFEGEMGMLVLDDYTKTRISNGPEVPNVYFRIAGDTGEKSKFGYKPVWHEQRWCFPNASRYIRKFQSRRSLLVWKILGERTDGFQNEDFPTEIVPGDASTLTWKGEIVAGKREILERADLDFDGRQCPPPEAIAGSFVAPDGSKVKVAPLSDEDRRTIVRWIDLGCPIDFDYDAQHQELARGWLLDEKRPTLTVTVPHTGVNVALPRLLVGMNDYFSGLDEGSFTVTADFPIAGAAPGENIGPKFVSRGDGVWELPLAAPITALEKGTLVVSVRDHQGNVARLERTFSVQPGLATADRATEVSSLR